MLLHLKRNLEPIVKLKDYLISNPNVPLYKYYSLQEQFRFQNIAYDNPELLKQLKAKLLKINQSIMADGVDWHLQ